MQLSIAIPIVIAAIVIVIRSSGIDKKPIVPKIAKHAIRFGMIAAKATLKDPNNRDFIDALPELNLNYK